MKIDGNPAEGLMGCIEGIRNCLIEIERYQRKKINGLLTMCAWCKKVRDDQGRWNNGEAILFTQPNAKYTHGICPDCAGKLIEEIDAC